MYVLGLDTALGALSVAILRDGVVVAHAFEEMARGQAEALAPMVGDMLAQARIVAADIDRVAVTTGPGTFTGQRVGLAFARGFASAIGKPAIGVTTLEAMAWAARVAHPDCATYVAAIDARRGEGYVQTFDAGLNALSPPQLLAMAAIIDLVRTLGAQARVVLCGSATSLITDALGPNASIVASLVIQPDAIHVARLSGRYTAATHPAHPLYLRDADARLPGPVKPLPVGGRKRP